MRILWFFLRTAFIAKFVLNVFRLVGVYLCYLAFRRKVDSLGQYIELTDRLFSAAGTNLLVHESTWNQEVYHRISYFLTDKDQRKNLDLVFQKTIGVYKLRIFECINPFYWLFLPKYIFKYLGYEPSKIVVSLSTFLYWVASTTATIILETVLENRYGDLLTKFVDMLP